MDVLARLLTGTADDAPRPGPADDYWYGPRGAMTASGLRIDPDGAKKISAWFRGREILAASLAMLPLHLYQRLPDDAGAEKATGNALYDALHRKPHPRLPGDAYTWRRQAMFDLIDHGWAYDLIEYTPQVSLRRIDPRRVKPEPIASGVHAGRLLFHVRDAHGSAQTYTQDEVFFRMASEGKGILEHARESLGLAKVTETYASNVFGSGSLSAGHITVPGPMDPESAKAMAQSFRTAAGDWHMPRVLPSGASYIAADALTPDKAQMLLSRKFSINDIARWLGLPPHMLGDLDRATFSNIEHQGQEFVTYALGPWLSLWEFAINDQLILQPRKFFAEFTRDALVRGDLATRWAAHVAAVNAGIKAVDEVRVVENMNRRGGKASELREPQNITGRPRAADPAPRPPGDEDEDPADEGVSDTEAGATAARLAVAEAIVVAASARILRKEIKRVQALAVRHAADQEAFAAAVTEFYAAHAQLVRAELALSAAGAAVYCAGQAAQIVAGSWVDAVRMWDTSEYAAGLATLALEQEAAA